MIHRLLCILGIHDWGYPYRNGWALQCRRCKKLRGVRA